MPLESAPSMGDMLQPADIKGHTLIVAPVEFIPHLPTVHTKPGEMSPAIRSNVVDFADPDNPVLYTGVLWFGVLSTTLKRKVGSFIAGRMSQGQGSPGKNPPWQLDSIEAEQDWMAHLNNWLDRTPVGQAFQAEAIKDTLALSNNPTQPEVEHPPSTPTPAPAAAPAPAPRPAPAAAAPAPSPATRPGGLGAPAPAAPAAAPVAAPAADLMAQLGGLPPGELEKALALLAQQNQAAH